MLQLLYNNEPLDISQSDNAELQQSSPLFGIEQSIAEYSTPITILYSDRNNRLLSHYFLELTSKQKLSVPVTIFENNTNSLNGTLVIETSNLNNFISSKANITGYVLVNISNFFNDIQDKKLSDLFLDGVRSFDYTTADPTDGSGGYWQHFQSTLDFTDDYVMLPAHNPGNPTYVDSVGKIKDNSEWVNLMNGSVLETNVNYVYPWIKVSYVLRKIVEEAGWQVDFTGLNDTEWQKLLLFPCGGIEVSTITTLKLFLRLDAVFVPFTTISFSLASFLDPNTLQSSFVLQFCYRYGWAPLIDAASKTIRFVALKEVNNFAVKDWTKYADPEGLEDYSKDVPTYSFKNNFTGSDAFTSDNELTGFVIGNPVLTKFDLPTPDPVYDYTLFFCESENQYYSQQYDTDSDTRKWQPYRDNIYNDETDNTTTDIETDVTSMATYWILVDGYNKNALLPYCEQSRLEAPGLRTVLFLGDAHYKNDDGTDDTGTYKFGSAINFLPGADTPALPWANVYKYSRGDVEYGIEEYWFDTWLNSVAAGNDVTRQIKLPLFELVKFKWDDKIIINNISYLVSQINRPIPYSGFVQCILKRIKTKAAIELTTQIIYIKKFVVIFNTGFSDTLTVKGVNTGDDYTYEYTNGVQAHVYVRTFSDLACTIPLTVKGLIIKYTKTIPNITGDIITIESVVLTGTEIDINANSVDSLIEYDVHITKSGFDLTGHVVIALDLVHDDAYQIVV
jgi:hypothetical protein